MFCDVYVRTGATDDEGKIRTDIAVAVDQHSIASNHHIGCVHAAIDEECRHAYTLFHLDR